MNHIPSVTLNRLALIDANYQYESTSDQSSDRPSQCLLLFGIQTESDMIVIERCMNVPLTLNFAEDLHANFEYDSDQIDARIKLLNVTNPQLSAIGVMIFNDRFYDYTKVVRKVKADKDSIMCLFTYEPQKSHDEEQKLYCYWIESAPMKLTRIDFHLQNSNIRLEKEVKCTEPLTWQQQLTGEKEITTKLIVRLERMIRYLESPHNKDAKILRSISMLVTQLKRHPTEDIEEEIMNKESEINALNIACEQWEIGTSRHLEDTL